VEAPEVRYAKSGDVSIAYSVAGDGPFDLVFVNGWIFSALELAWEGPPAEFFTRLASFSRLILFDKRGTGLSDRDTGMPDLETRMDDIRAVMDALGSNRAAIMGVSEGGPMTFLFGATYPERTAAAIGYGCGVSFVQTTDYPWANSQEQWDELIRDMSSRGTPPEWLDERLADEAPSLARDDAVRRWWRRWVLTSASPGAVNALWRMNMEIDARPVLPTIRVPTLLLHRAGDRIYDIEEARYIAERVPNAELVELPGEDHAWWVDPEPVADEVGQFLRTLWDRGEWDLVETDRVLATLPFTDIVGSTAKAASSVMPPGGGCWSSTTR
jgi:pimeloyl-ACP methyl ester carboxylesterase